MATTTAITPALPATQVVSGTGATIVDLVQATTARLTLTVTAASGTTPTLDVTVQTSPDQVTWTPLGVFPTATVAGAQLVSFPGASRFLRVSWAIGGTTPSFTFGVAGVSVIVYATPADLAMYGAPETVLSQITPSDMDRYLSAATDYANSLIANHQELPLLQWGEDLREAVSTLAIWSIMSRRVGFNPEAGSDLAFKLNRDAAREFLKGVGEGDIQLADCIDSATPIDEGGAQIYSDTPRGWDR